MTFDEWWDTTKPAATPETFAGWERSCRQAWNAAQLAERKRLAHGHLLRLSDPEMKPTMDALKQRIKDEPGFGASLLRTAGIINPDGTLSEKYGGQAWIARRSSAPKEAP